MPSNGISSAVCWYCSAGITAAQAAIESVLQPRTAAEGGPFLSLTCPSCRTTCGALRNRRGDWMLYPLEGSAEPTLIDRLLPRTSRAHTKRARDWWLRHAGDIERFRAAAPRRGERRQREDPDVPPPPPRPRPRPRPRPKAPRAPAPAAARSARQVLGVGDAATLRDVRAAWRVAVKRWHPDRIPSKDPVVVQEAQRRFHEIHAAYETLVAELGTR
jgi:hypothetical protein